MEFRMVHNQRIEGGWSSWGNYDVKWGQQYDQKVVEVKQKELSMMDSYDVIEEVEKGNYQCISSRWFVTEKFKMQSNL